MNKFKQKGFLLNPFRFGGGGGGGSAPTLVSGTDGSGSGTSLTATVTGAVGDTFVIGVRWYGTTPVLNSVAISGESNATLLGSAATGGPSNGKIQFAILSNITTAGSKTITCTMSASVDGGAPFVWRISGANTTTANDGNPVTTTGSVTSVVPTLNITTTVNNCLLCVIGNTDYSLTAVQSPYVVDTLADTFYYDMGGHLLDAGTAGSKTVALNAVTGTYLIGVLAIKPA